MSDNNAKVVRTVIYLGHIPLEVFMLSDSSYLLSQAQVSEAVEKDEKSFRRFLRSKSPESLPYKGFTPGSFPVDGARIRIKGIPIKIAAAYWTKETISGNIIAARLLGACTAESIERRADIAFGIQREEVERQAIMEARIKGKQTRRQLTDAIRDYLARHPEVSDNHRKWMYSNASDAVNLVVFKKRSHRLCADLGVSKEHLRDQLDGDELQLVREVENTSMRMIDRWDIDPLEAIKQCGDRLAIA